MTRSRAHAVVLAAVASGCTPVEPGIDALDELEDPEIADDRDAWIPEGEEITWPKDVVEPTPRATGGPRFEIRPGGHYGDCFMVAAHGFPAIDEHGEVAIPLAHMRMLSSWPGTLALEWLAADGTQRKTPLVTEADMLDTEKACAKYRRDVGARLRDANDELAARNWRQLEQLPVELPDPEYHDPTRVEETPAHERPVQALVRHGQLVVRIPGVRVLERHDIDAPYSYLHRVYVDRTSDTVIAVLARCEGEDCTCDPGFFAYRTQWNAETFEAIEQHPCISEGEQNTCWQQALPFEAPVEPWAL
jgi:hypothetical protein